MLIQSKPIGHAGDAIGDEAQRFRRAGEQEVLQSMGKNKHPFCPSLAVSRHPLPAVQALTALEAP